MTAANRWEPAQKIAGRIRAGELTSREVVESALERVEAAKELNAVVTLDVTRARRQADAADAAIRGGEEVGPLHGVPVTVKDMVCVAGMRTTNGQSRYRDFVPQKDAVAVERLRQAGAVIIGKTNTPPNGADVVTHNTVFGMTRNPWDLSRTPGGSSGGSAAAVAAGLVPLDLGGDIGGSIRLPAHFCGIYGHKPSFGIVPGEGTMPIDDPRPVDMAVLGPLARSAADLDLALTAIAGPGPSDGKAWRLDLPPPRHSALGGYRLAVWLDDPTCSTDRAVLAVLEAAVTRLRDAGAQITSAHPVDLDAAHDLYFRVLDGEVHEEVPAHGFFTAVRPMLPKRFYAMRRLRYATSPHAEWLKADATRHRLRKQWRTFFQDFDALLCPVARVAAPALDERPLYRRSLEVDGRELKGVKSYLSLTAWSSLASASYLPATVVPVGFTEAGLPVGMQIIADHLDDRTSIGVASQVEGLGLAGGRRPDIPDSS